MIDEGIEMSVGIVVPTLGKRPELLIRCLESIRSQRVPKHIVLVDSSAGTLCQSDIHHLVDKIIETEPAGLSAAINAGFKHLEQGCQVFTWLGDDDFFAPDGLVRLSAALLSSPGSPFSAGGCNYLDDKGRIFWKLEPNNFGVLKTKYLTTAFAQPACLIRTISFEQIGGLSEDLHFAMDLDLWLKLSGLGKPAIVRDTVANYTWHESSLSAANELEAIEEAKQVRRQNMGPFLAAPSAAIAHIAYLRSKLGISTLNSLSRHS